MQLLTHDRPGWLPRVLDWAIHYNDPGANTPQGSTYGFSDTLRLRIKHIYNNVDSLLGEVKFRSRFPSVIVSLNFMSLTEHIMLTTP